MEAPMRTTIYLPDDLLMEAKKLAVESRCTLTAIIEQSLREKMISRFDGEPLTAVHLTAYGKGGLFPGIDLDDTSALLDVMEESHAPDGC